MPVEVRLVADAGEEEGLGHIARSTALATALGCRRLQIDCLAAGASKGLELDGIRWRPLREPGEIAAPPAPAVVVLDSYTLPLDAVVAMAAPSQVVVFRDSREVPEGVALVVDVAGYPDGQGPGELTGLGYAPLRPDYWGLPRRRLEDRVERVLVTTGAGDPGGLGEALACAAREALGGGRVTIVRGRYADVDPPPGVELLDAPQSLLGPLLAADVVVSAAGQTMLEAAAAGTPCVVLALADNQRRQATRLAELGIVRLVDPPGAVGVREGLAELAARPDLRGEMSAKGQRAVDGCGALRIAFHVSRLVSRAT